MSSEHICRSCIVLFVQHNYLCLAVVVAAAAAVERGCCWTPPDDALAFLLGRGILFAMHGCCYGFDVVQHLSRDDEDVDVDDPPILDMSAKSYF